MTSILSGDILRRKTMTAMMAFSAAVLLAVTSCEPLGLQRTFERLGRAAGGRVGASARVLEDGGARTVSSRGSERFPMQSVYKAAIDFAVLQRVDAGEFRLDQAVRVEKADLPPAGVVSPIRDAHPDGGFEMSLEGLLRAAIVESDGTACDALLRLFPADRVTRALRDLGVTGMVVATTEAEMTEGPDVQYRNWATPDSTLELLAALQQGRGLEPKSRARLLRWMTETPTGPGRLKGKLPPAAVVAHKTGTSGTNGGLTRATNDVGIVTLPDGRHLLIAVYVSDSRAGASVREGVIAKIARAAWDCWTRPPAR